jgi:hypothetical protein
MTVYENSGQFDASNVWFEKGAIKEYDKRNKVPAMRHIDYGLGAFREAAFEGFPRDEVVDLAEVQKALLARNELAGFEVGSRFFEVGSHAGLQELDRLLRRNDSAVE